MIVLDTTSHVVQAKLAGATATNPVQAYAAYRDITTTTYTPGHEFSTHNSTSDVAVVSAPGSSTQRVVDFISFYNNDTADVTLTAKLDVSATERILWKGVLKPGGRVEFANGRGWTAEPLRGYRPEFWLPFHISANAAFNLTNSPLVERFVGGVNAFNAADLSGYQQVKIVRCGIVASLSAAAQSKIRALYRTSLSITLGDYSQLGASEQVQMSMYLQAGGMDESKWFDLATNAKANDIVIALTELDGEGTSDPAFTHFWLVFR